MFRNQKQNLQRGPSREKKKGGKENMTFSTVEKKNQSRDTDASHFICTGLCQGKDEIAILQIIQTRKAVSTSAQEPVSR